MRCLRQKPEGAGRGAEARLLSDGSCPLTALVHEPESNMRRPYPCASWSFAEGALDRPIAEAEASWSLDQTGGFDTPSVVTWSLRWEADETPLQISREYRNPCPCWFPRSFARGC